MNLIKRFLWFNIDKDLLNGVFLNGRMFNINNMKILLEEVNIPKLYIKIKYLYLEVVLCITKREA